MFMDMGISFLLLLFHDFLSLSFNSVFCVEYDDSVCRPSHTCISCCKMVIDRLSDSILPLAFPFNFFFFFFAFYYVSDMTES